MSTFNAFIETAAKGLGVSTEQAGSAAGGLLNLVMDKTSEADGASLLQALPGASEFISSARPQPSGGMLGGLAGAAGKMLGGKAGSALGVMSIFKNANLDSAQGASLTTMFFSMLTRNAGPDLVSRVLESVPELKKLMGN